MHLVGFIVRKKLTTMHGHLKVKFGIFKIKKTHTHKNDALQSSVILLLMFFDHCIEIYGPTSSV